MASMRVQFLAAAVMLALAGKALVAFVRWALGI